MAASTEILTGQLEGKHQNFVPTRSLRLAEIALEEEIAGSLAARCHLPRIKLASTTIDPDALRTLTEERVRQWHCLPVKREAVDIPGIKNPSRPVLVVAISDPGDLNTIAAIEFATGCKVKPVVATRAEIEDAIERYYAPERLLAEALKSIDNNELKVIEPSADVEGGKNAGPGPAVKFVNLIIQHGIKAGATDIHLEPTLHDFHIRIRQTGLLRDFTTLPKWLQAPVISRLKILAQLDITERRRPQDGRIKVMLDDRDVDLRVSVLPTHFGEKVVLRILGASQKLPATAELGLEAADLEALMAASQQPQGLILVTGPTGSGKTTTLYSIINEMKSPSINITTVEDPIEIQLPGLNQVAVNTETGMTFASSLRSILRQDPDVILIGEIRDKETQQIAFHAAMTGHLVMSTLHTNGSVSTVKRLCDLGVEPHTISDSVHLIVAQRLIRTVCESCKSPYEPDPSALERLHLDDAGLTYWQGRGCDACNRSGYGGQIPIFEMLRLTPPIKRLIEQSASEAELRKAAEMAGTRFLLTQALERVRAGITTPEEVLRVLELEEETVTLCPHCAKRVNSEFVQCPFCLHQLKHNCSSCKQELQAEWRICPYCSTEIEAAREALAPASFAEIAAQPVKPSLPQSAIASRRVRILVVDDDAVNRRLASKALSQMPSQPEVFEAKDGFEALSMTNESRPDLIVLDVMMPGMSGFDVCRKLREQVETAFIPVIMLTASSSEEHRTEGFLTGTDDYMGKPFAIPELHARVSRLLRRTYGF